jgi:hypothetical protein
MPFRANTLSNVYTPEELEHYYKMRGKKASTGTGSSLKKLAESKKETAKPEPHGSLVADFLGKKVSARLLDGSTVRGELMKASKYELLLKTEGGEEVVLFKHAVAYILPASTL